MSLTETQLLLPQSAVAYYAKACALCEQWAFVGNPNAPDGGKVYAYKWNSTTKQFPVAPTQTLDCPGGGNKAFGASVAVSGYRLLVGAPYATNVVVNAGLVYAYLYNPTTGQWEFDGTLKASDPVTGDYFGSKVAIDDDVAAIGVYQQANRAYVFEHNGSSWPETEVQILTSSDNGGADRFGMSVAVSKPRILVGAPYHNHPGEFFPPGAAYMFLRTGGSPLYTEEDELLADDGSWYDGYGKACSLVGDTAVIGAPDANTPTTDTGAAYVHKRSGSEWPQFKKLAPVAEGVGEGNYTYAGRDVSFDGVNAIVGGPGSGDAYPGPGVVNTGRGYLYTAPDFTTPPQVLIPAVASANDRWGFAVAAYGGTGVMLGGYADDTADIDWGAASFWGELPGPPFVTDINPPDQSNVPRSTNVSFLVDDDTLVNLSSVIVSANGKMIYASSAFKEGWSRSKVTPTSTGFYFVLIPDSDNKWSYGAVTMGVYAEDYDERNVTERWTFYVIQDQSVTGISKDVVTLQSFDFPFRFTDKCDAVLTTDEIALNNNINLTAFVWKHGLPLLPLGIGIDLFVFEPIEEPYVSIMDLYITEGLHLGVDGIAVSDDLIFTEEDNRLLIAIPYVNKRVGKNFMTVLSVPRVRFS